MELWSREGLQQVSPSINCSSAILKPLGFPPPLSPKAVESAVARCGFGEPGDPSWLCYLMTLMVFAEGGSSSTSTISSSSKYSS